MWDIIQAILVGIVDVLATILGVKKGAVIIGFLSALISLRFVPDMKNRWQKLTMVVSGFLFTVYVSPMVAEMFELRERTESGVTFLLGLFGMSLAAAFITIITSGQLWEFIKIRLGGASNSGGSPISGGDNPLAKSSDEDDK